MHRSLCYKLLTRSIGRELSDEDWQVVEPLHIKSWSAAEQLWTGVEVSLKGNSFVVRPDLSSAVYHLSHHLDIMQRVFDRKDMSAACEFRHEIMTLKFFVEEMGEFGGQYSYSDDLVEYIMYEMFIAMNIAVPGSCNLSGAKLHRHPADTDIYGNEIITNIDLSGRPFEAAVYEANDLKWLPITHLELSTVLEWTSAVCPRITMLPNSPAAKAIFALQHLAKGKQGPTSIIWVFYGLESLLQCKPGENFRVMVERLSMLFGLNDKDKGSLRVRLRELYDLRSGLVHGGHRVAHPLYNGLMNDDEENNSFGYVRRSDFGAALLIASLQRIVALGWKYPTFTE